MVAPHREDYEAPGERPDRAPESGPWWRRRSGLATAAQAVVVALVLGWLLVGWVHDRVVGPLLAYREDGDRVTVRVHDGCLRYRRDQPPRTPDIVLDYCGWRRPEGVAEWVPQTRELLVLNRSGTRVEELVAFGMVPAGTTRVRYTLPGGEVVETEARQRDGLAGPAFWVRLRGVAIPVDLAAVDGEVAVARFQIFDRAGNEIPVV
jgi:hypothetical protein